MNHIKKALRLYFVATMLLSVLAAPTMAYDSADFPDVAQDYWAYDDIMTVAELGIVRGYDTGFYGPLDQLTVGAFLSMVGRALYPSDCEETGTDYWWQTYYFNALEKGVVTADEYVGTTKAMGADISRNEMARIMVRADEIVNGNAPVTAVLRAIPDWKDIPAEFQPFAAQAYCKGLLTGKPCGFAGNDTLTRAEAATVIVRLLGAATQPGPVEVWDDSWREGAPVFIQEVVDELERKGWKNFELTEGEVDSTKWGGMVLDTPRESDDSMLCTLLGQTDGLFDNPITVAVQVSFNKESLVWKREAIFYISKSGRYWEEEHLYYGEMLVADSQELYDYMYSY